MKAEELEEIRGMLGHDAVLLPIRRGSKGPSRKAWPETTLEQTKSASYRDQLLAAPAVGVLLGILVGEPSGSLCSIDWDKEDELEEFLELNPRLRESLRTKGRRGANVWVLILGNHPPTRKLVLEGGSSSGEWRARGNQTVIAGEHPDGGRYSYLVRAVPVSIRFDEIHWPSGLTPFPHSSPISPSTPFSPTSPTSPVLQSSPPLQHKEGKSLGARLQVESAARSELEGKTSVQKLYRLFVERRFTPAVGRRNADLVEMITFLFHVADSQIVLELAIFYYRLNAGVFRDSLDQHIREAKAQLKAVDASWLAGLSVSDRESIHDLPGDYVTSFRILRDLAMKEDSDFPRGSFCMSHGHLGERLGIHSTQAGRILRVFEANGWISIVKKGDQRSKLNREGAKRQAKATVWRWVLPLPPPAADPAESGFVVQADGKVIAEQVEMKFGPP